MVYRECVHSQPSIHISFNRSSMEYREMIGAALTETRGQAAGASGAAARLGIPLSTLESRIRSMNINKYQFKTG